MFVSRFKGKVRALFIYFIFIILQISMNANPTLVKTVELALTEFSVLPAYAQHLIMGHTVMVSTN